MIATRRRSFHLPIKAILQAVVVLAGIYLLLTVPLTHKLIFNGPAKPVWKQADALEKKYLAPTLDPVLAPLSLVNLTRKLQARDMELIALKKKLRGNAFEQKVGTQRIHTLERQLAAKHGGASTATIMPVNAAPGTTATSPTVEITPSPDEMKTAGYWSSMEAENAAAVAQKLNPEETARIFLAMKPDQVAEIMNVLPADYNVKLQAVRLSYPRPVAIAP